MNVAVTRGTCCSGGESVCLKFGGLGDLCRSARLQVLQVGEDVPTGEGCEARFAEGGAMTFALGAARSGCVRADQTVHFHAGRKGKNRVRRRMPSDVNASFGWLVRATNLCERPSTCRRHYGAERMQLCAT